MPSLFRKEAVDQQRERLWGDVILIQPFSFWIITAVTCVTVIIVIVFLAFGSYARRENVTGYLVPDRGLVKVYADTPGIVLKTHTQEGDRVEPDDLLFTISTLRNTDQSGDVDAYIISELEKTKANLEKQHQQQQRLSTLEITDLTHRVSGLEEEIAQLQVEIGVRKTQYDTARERLERLEELLSKKYISEDQYKEQQEHSLGARLSLEESKRTLIAKRNTLTETRSLLAQHPMKATLDIANLEQSIAEVNQKLEEIKARRIYTIRAPIAGRVTAQQTQTGQTAKTDTPLLAILPENAVLEAQLFVPTRAIGFIKPGQQVLLQYSAFPYQRFGLHAGKITQVTETIFSPDELPVPVPLQEPVYRITVKPLKQFITAYGHDIQLQAGMLLNADIILERRSLGQWLLDPLYSLTGRL